MNMMHSHGEYSFGELLKQFRAREGKTQQELATDLKVHRQTASSWERSLWLPETKEMVLKLAEVLSLNERDTDELLYAANFPPQYSVGRNELTAPEQIPAQKISTSRLPATGSHLFGRLQELQLLNDAMDNPTTNILSLVAWGGIGKSALINHWLAQMSQDGYRGARRVFAWSFYTQGVTDLVVSSDVFIEVALRWFDDPAPSRGSAWERGERLAQLVKSDRNLLILDGLEPLQYPPGSNGGKLKDLALIAFLRELAAFNKGLCVISTRLPIADLSQYEESTCPRLDLKPLSPQAGAELLRSEGIFGKQEELERASTKFGGHSLALTLLGSYLRDVYNGDVRQHNKISLLKEDVHKGGHASRVMMSYETWFGEGPELGILRLVGLFDRPASEQAIAALRFGSSIPNLTDILNNLSESDWQRTVAGLRRSRLIAERNPDQPGMLDAHPLVREYFGQQLRRRYHEAWREGNNVLYEHHKSAAEQLPVTIEEMEPLFSAMIYSCKAGRHQDALHEVYIPRIMRGDEFYAANNLGAVGALVSVLSHFFEDQDWGQISPALGHADKLTVLTEAGRYLTEVKGYAASEVGLCYTQAEELCDPGEDRYWLYEVMLGLCRFYRMRGELQKSGTIANRLLSISESFNEHRLLPAAYRALATNSFYTGDFRACDEYAKKGLVDYSSAQEALISAQLDVNEPGISCLGYRALALWFLGYPDLAQETGLRTLRLAGKLSHAHTLAITLLIIAMIHQFRQNETATRESAEELIKFCTEHGFSLWRISGEILYDWALAKSGNVPKDIAEGIKESIVEWQDTEAYLFTPYWFGLLADVYLGMGYVDEGLISVAKGLELSKRNGERWWNAELYNLRGKLQLIQSDSLVKVERYFSKSLEVARAQEARSLELRSAISLAQLWKRQSRGEDANKLLSSLYNRFQEGFSTKDLQEARRLLALS